MASTLKIRIKDGVTTVEADGTKLSCDTAHDVQKAIGETTSERKTGHKPESTTLVQR